MQAIDAHDDLADPGLAVLGRGLPAAAEALIARAGLIRNRVAEAQALLDEAHALAPTHPATLIALYRFHFYGNRLSAAREVGVRAIACAAAALDLPADWRRVGADARFRALEPMPRFWLFSLKGYAYLSARLGDLEVGRAALAKLSEMDPEDKVGHRVIGDVLARMGRDDLGYEDCPDIAAQAGATS